MPVSSGICRQRMPDAKCVARKVCIPVPRLRNSRTLSPLHALLRQHALVVCHSVFGRILSFERQDLQSEALISQKHLTLTPINHSYETSTQSCRTLQSCYPWIFRVLGHKSFTNPSGNTCATFRSLVSFLSWNGLWVSEPCQLIPSFTEGPSKERLGRLIILCSRMGESEVG